MKNPTTLEDFHKEFKRNAISDMTPPKIARAIEGGFYAGAQAAIVLLTEALHIEPATAPEKVNLLIAECQTFFVTAKAQRDSENEPKFKTTK